MGFVKILIAPIADLIKSALELKKTKIRAEATVTENAANSVAEWEKLAAQNAGGSLLDELWTAVLLVPLILAFCGYGDSVAAGFAALETMPDFYVWAVMASVGWAFARKDLPSITSWRRKK